MKITKFMIVVVMMLLVSSVSFAQSSNVEYDRQKREAMVLYNEGRFEESYNLLMKLFREQPDDTTLYVAIGRAAYGAKNYNQSIMGYEKAIANNPNSSLLYIELASVYNTLKDYNKARELLVIAKEKGAGERGVDIDRFIASVDNSLETTFFSGVAGLTLGFDTNVNYGVIAKDIVLGGLPLTVSDGSLPKSSPFLTANTFLNLVEKFDPNNNSAMLIADLGVYSKLFSNSDVTQNNFLWVGASVGARFSFDSFYFDILAKGNYTTYDFMSSVLGYGAEVRFNKSLPAGFFSRTTLNVEAKDYAESPDSNGITATLSERLNYAIYEKGFMTFAVDYTLKDGEIGRVSYNQFGGRLSYTQTLPKSIFLEPSVGVDYSLYQDPATVLELEDRSDVLINAGLSFTWHFIKDFSANLNYSYSHNISNSPIYDYDQHIVTAAVSYYF